MLMDELKLVIYYKPSLDNNGGFPGMGPSFNCKQANSIVQYKEQYHGNYYNIIS